MDTQHAIKMKKDAEQYASSKESKKQDMVDWQKVRGHYLEGRIAEYSQHQAAIEEYRKYLINRVELYDLPEDERTYTAGVGHMAKEALCSYETLFPSQQVQEPVKDNWHSTRMEGDPAYKEWVNNADDTDRLYPR